MVPTLSRFSLVSGLLLLLTLAACGEDDDPTSSTADKTPPAIEQVAPWDERTVVLAFSEEIDQVSAENRDHYLITTVPVAARRQSALAASDTLRVAAAVLINSYTVSINTESSMADLDLQLSVAGVSDASGNETNTSTTFRGSNITDRSLPFVIRYSPRHNEGDVSLDRSVTVSFSEAIQEADFLFYADHGQLGFDLTIDGAVCTLTPHAPLEYHEQYTIEVLEAVDYSGNAYNEIDIWSFYTIESTDATPPIIVTTTPPSYSENVDVNTTVSITFSEPVKQSLFDVDMTPFSPGFSGISWSLDGTTVTLDLTGPLLTGQQYALTLLPERVVDIAGNNMQGLTVAIFTTGTSLAIGSISGTLRGDEGTAAAHPIGATVLAAKQSLLTPNGDVQVVGLTVALANATYVIPHVPDDTYFPLALVDTNGDGRFNPREGDAIGAWGLDIAANDDEPANMVVSGGSDVTWIDFPLYDSTALTGWIGYTGESTGDLHVGLFVSNGFDPYDLGAPVATSEPDYQGTWPENPTWNLNTFVQPLPDDDYVLGVYIDANANGLYDSATDPIGFYRDRTNPTPLSIGNGRDLARLVVPVFDPLTNASSTNAGVRWAAPTRHAAVRLADAISQMDFSHE